jgi:hypothetical protein
MKYLLMLLAVLALGCEKKEATKETPKGKVTTEDKEDPPPPPPPKEKSIGEKIDESTTAAAALALAKPHMKDATDKDDNPGGLAFARWSAAHLRWADVEIEKDETTHGKVMKDSEEELGKRMCNSGSVVQISVLKLPSGKKLSYGLLLTGGGNLYQFYAALSSGDLVEGKHGRLCGFVTGTYTYANSGGGTGHAVSMVGIFDLPENRKG